VTIVFRNDPRRVIPRWRMVALSVQGGEMDPLAPKKSVVHDDTHFLDAVDQFRFRPVVETANEVIEGAIVLGRKSMAKAAARFILNQPMVRDSCRELAIFVLNEESTNEPGGLGASEQRIRLKIARLKANLIEYPNNPITWIELARCYVTLGQGLRSYRAIRAALTLAPSYRYVLRSAARFYIHQRDAERAFDLLDRAQVTLRDPWLMAAQLATAQVADVNPKNIKLAERMAESKSFSPRQISELNSALGGIELANGRHRFARRYFSKSLIDPTENALAQAIWTREKLPLLIVPLQPLQELRTYEANAWQAYSKHRWRDTVNACKEWLDDEPFSSRPAVLGSFVCAVAMEDYSAGELICRDGLLANPNSKVLKNNLAVTLACQGKTPEARTVLSQLMVSTIDSGIEPTLIATQGLIAFREGKVEIGRGLYRKAMDMFGHDARLHALALLHFALEEVRVGSASAGLVAQEAEQAVAGSEDPGLQILLDRLRARLAVPREGSKITN
jgi:tetratricopeptide (TPR) repeat protein